MAEALVESGTSYPADILLLEEHLAVHPHDKAVHASLAARLIESGFLHEVQLHIRGFSDPSGVPLAFHLNRCFSLSDMPHPNGLLSRW
jgi:hypothetical protein